MIRIAEISAASWEVLLDSAPFLLLGLAVTGVIHLFLTNDVIARHLGGGGWSSTLKAALFGAPLPLCSCGVIPAAVALNRRGASPGATAAFLISTPETSVDSIAMTYALLDPLMTVARPLSALVIAVMTGSAVTLFERRPAPPIAGGSGGPCCHRVPPAPAEHRSWREQLREALRFGAIEMIDDIGHWFLLGVAIAGLVTTLIPDHVVSSYFGGGIGSMLLMLVTGIPLYICASASTPIAAALVFKGMSPGTALVFLLAGAATNMMSLTILVKTFGWRFVAIYIAGIAGGALLMGLLLDAVYALFGIVPQALAGGHEHGASHLLHVAGAGILLGLIGWSFVRRLRARHVMRRPPHRP